jgi:hypothetical protein
MKLTKSQRAVMIWMSKGWKAYVAGGKTRVEINGHRVATLETMNALERAGLVARLGVSAWEATEAGRQWTHSEERS